MKVFAVGVYDYIHFRDLIKGHIEALQTLGELLCEDSWRWQSNNPDGYKGIE